MKTKKKITKKKLESPEKMVQNIKEIYTVELDELDQLIQRAIDMIPDVRTVNADK